MTSSGARTVRPLSIRRRSIRPQLIRRWSIRLQANSSSVNSSRS